MSHVVDCYGLTDPGRVREVNEDQFLVADLDKSMLVRQTSLPPDDHTRLFGPHQGHLLLVADGLGGHPGGRRASQLTTEALIRYVLTTLPWFLRLRHDEEHDLGEELLAALEDCQRRVKEAQVADPGRGRMATTLTMAYVLWPRLYVVHAGDTRAYLLRGGALHQVTRDHTIARQMVEAGKMAPEAAEQSRLSHVLYNCVGGSRDELAPDVYRSFLRPGDVLLLCSDGLTKHVSDGRIAEVLGSGGRRRRRGVWWPRRTRPAGPTTSPRLSPGSPGRSRRPREAGRPWCLRTDAPPDSATGCDADCCRRTRDRVQRTHVVGERRYVPTGPVLPPGCRFNPEAREAGRVSPPAGDSRVGSPHNVTG